MATRFLGLGTVFSCDYDSDADYDTIPLIVDGMPPAREWEEIDDTTLDSTLQTNTLGIEKHSHFDIRLKWDTTDTVHNALFATLFDTKAERNWRIVYTSGTNETWTMPGKLVKFEPQRVEHNKHYEAILRIHRTGAITVS